MIQWGWSRILVEALYQRLGSGSALVPRSFWSQAVDSREKVYKLNVGGSCLNFLKEVQRHLCQFPVLFSERQDTWRAGQTRP